MKILCRARERTRPPSRSTTLPFSPCVSLGFCRHRRAESAPNTSPADASRPRQDRAKTPPTCTKKHRNRRCFRPRIPPWSHKFRFSLGKFVHLRSKCETRSCEKRIFAAVLQWFTENAEITCARSTPKCVFLGNGDGSFGALGGLTAT